MSLPLLGFLSYAEYLQTDHWRETRAAALERAAGRCALCDRTGLPLNVHHRSYERLGEELPEDLTVAHEECHEAYELGRQILGGA
jgi:5-methylcytosine-specific restriction endonuclease McrA